METSVEILIGKYGWLFLVGIATLLFQSTIQEAVDGIMVFLGNDYNEDDVVEVDGSPGRIVRVGLWKTTFFIYHVVRGQIVGGSKLVVANSKLKDLKIEKPLPNLDLSKYQDK
jgi:small-conductance mechanosensitive channel